MDDGMSLAIERGIHTYIADAALVNVSVSVRHDPIIQAVLIQMVQSLLAEPKGTIQYPADWWQAFKARWYPRWAKRRWPVRYTVMQARVLYPDVKLPNERAWWEWRKIDAN